jgi:hypothetical protein
MFLSSFNAFLKPVSIGGSPEVRSMLSVSYSEYSERCAGVVNIAAYDNFILLFSGWEGAQSNSYVAVFGLGVHNLLTNHFA